MLRRLVPVAVSGSILYFYLRDVDWTALRGVTARADLKLAVIAVVIPQLLSWLLGTLIVERTLNWFHGPFPFRRFFWVRGAIYLLIFINNALGGGGIVLYQQRRAQIRWTKLFGILLFRVGMGAWGVGLLMIPLTLAIHAYGFDQQINMNLSVWWTVLILGLLWLIDSWLFWHRGIETPVARRIVRDRNSEFWTAFRLSKPRHWGLSWCMMLPQLIATAVGYHVLNRAFGIEAPLIESLVVMPLVMLIMDLPFAFAGFGTATLAWMAYFGDYGSAADITALTLFLPTARMLCRALIGITSLPFALPEIDMLLRSLRRRRGSKLFSPADDDDDPNPSSSGNPDAEADLPPRPA